MKKEKKSKQSEEKSQPISSRFVLNIITVVASMLVCICVVVMLVIVIKQAKLQSLVSSLGLIHLIPPMKAYYLPEIITQSTEAPYYLAQSMSSERVICSHPLLTAVGSAIAIFGALSALYQVFRSMSWYRGYKNSRCCTLYFFLYHSDYYAPLRIKSLAGHMHMYKMENMLLPKQIILQRNYLWDTVTINWDDVCIRKHEAPVAMPITVTVPLPHKIKTRNIMRSEFNIQVTLKQGNDWVNIRNWTSKKVRHVQMMCAALEREEPPQ